MENVPKKTRGRITCHEVALDWWAIAGAIFSVLGSVATLCWLFPSDRGWSSIPAYFDPRHPFAIAVALLGIGGVLSLVADIRGAVVGRKWVVVSYLIGSVSVGIAALVVVVVPIVIWIIKVLIWVFTVVFVAIALWALPSLSRGRMPRWPRTPQGVAHWIRKAVSLVPFGG